MKIGIISINAHTKVLNFASPLHSYIFQDFLRDHGIESKIIDYTPGYYGKFDARHPLYYFQNHPLKDEKEQANVIKKWTTLFKEREYRYDRFDEFIQKYYDKTDTLYNPDILDTVDPGFDCYICATDVIWKHTAQRGFDRGFFLACKQMDGKKKIAYAASRGPGDYTHEQAQLFFDYISDFDFISVRENSLKKYIEKRSDIPVTHVLDPVFLKEKEFYYNLAIEPEKKGYVLLYIVMENAKDLVKTAVHFAELHNLEVIELSEKPSHADIPKGTHHEVKYDLGIEEWLGYMKNAEYIFTNSFHACCFSIIFGKQFFAGARSGDKIDSVLELFNLSWRRVIGVAPQKAHNMQDIDYTLIDNKRREYIKSSQEFILNAIHTMENSPHKNHKDLVHAKVYKPERFPRLKKLIPKMKHSYRLAIRLFKKITKS